MPMITDEGEGGFDWISLKWFGYIYNIFMQWNFVLQIFFSPNNRKLALGFSG